MAWKIRHARQKRHHEAVKLDNTCRGLDASTDCALSRDVHMVRPGPENTQRSSQPLAGSPLPPGIFAGTNITPEALVQTLTVKETPAAPLPRREILNKVPTGRQLAKKEKMNERRERWLKKIRFIKQTQVDEAAKAHRQAMPVVGDLRPLVDALPDLCPSTSPPPATATSTRHRMSRKNKMPVKRPEPTDFSQMKQSHKRKLLEMETSRFSDILKMLHGKSNPLADIGEQLRKRMREEEEHSPS